MMIDVAALRRRIGQGVDGECHLSSDEARCIFAVYEAACTWRDDRGEIAGRSATRADEADDRLITVVDMVRRAP